MAKPLASVVGPIHHAFPGIGTGYQCHQATLFWMCEAQFGVPPSASEMLESTNILKGLIACGKRLMRTTGNFSARAGTLLVFADMAGVPKHSCIAISDTLLGGYNQQNWFAMAGPEAASKYTSYLQSQIRWLSPTTVEGNTPGNSCQLIGINEVSALGNLRTVIDHALRNTLHP